MTLYNITREVQGELMLERGRSAQDLRGGFQLEPERLTREELCHPWHQLADLSDFLPSDYYAPDSAIWTAHYH